MPISQGGSSSNLQFTSSKFPGKETEPVLTAGEVNDISMGVGQRLLDEETPTGEVLIGTLDIDPLKLKANQPKSTVPRRFLPAQLIAKYKTKHPDWNDQH